MRFSPWRVGPLAALSFLGFGGAFAACSTPGPTVVVPACDDPGTVQVRGMDTGLEFCTGGPVHRAKILSCPRLEPAAGICNAPGDPPALCNANADCTGMGSGYICGLLGPQKPCGCVPSCTSDIECILGNLCLCGDPFSGCVRALCQSDADCTGGHLCVESQLESCGARGFACQSDLDECQTDLDCPGSRPCLYRNDHRVCPANGCAG
jgi:hypothetical protein